MKSKTPLLSIVIVSYNTKEVLEKCLDSLSKVNEEVNFEIIVSDNGSTDGTIEMIKKKYLSIILLENNENLGFAAGNNKARNIVKGKYVLFLNSDTIVLENALSETIEYIEKDSTIGAITCKVVLPNGELDKDTRRSFPTPWVAFTHFSYLDRIFPTSTLLSRYWYGYKSSNETSEIDVLQGAFLLARRSILNKVDWFDEAYFLDAEDIDLCWKIKKSGMKIIYYPKAKIIHLKKATKRKVKIKSRVSGVKAMEIFYKKRLWSNYPLYINLIVLTGIKTILLIRLIKAHLRL